MEIIERKPQGKGLVIEDRSSSLMDDVLKDYNQPVVTEPAPVSPAQPLVNGPATVPGTTPAAQGQQQAVVPPVEVYKTGPKAGQPRPPRKVRVAYKHNPEIAQIGGELLSGYMFLLLVDMMLPMLIVGLNNRFSKTKLKASEMQMTEKQKKELAPIADKVMAQVNIQANPTLLLIISMVGIYGANYAALQLEKSLNQKPNEKANQQPVKNTGGQNYPFDPTQYVQRAAI